MLVEFIAMMGGELNHSFREAIVVLLLLHGVVQRGVAEVFFAVGNEEFFEL